MLFKIVVLKYFAMSTGNWEPSFNKVAGRFPANIAKFLRTVFFIEHFRWLLLKQPSRDNSRKRCSENM